MPVIGEAVLTEQLVTKPNHGIVTLEPSFQKWRTNGNKSTTTDVTDDGRYIHSV